MELTHRHSSFTIDVSCLNNEINKMPTPLLNIEHDLGIDNNVIDNLMPLSNILFLKEEQLATPVHNNVPDLNLNPSKQSTPTITQPDNAPITSVVEDQTNTLIPSSSNVKNVQIHQHTREHWIIINNHMLVRFIQKMIQHHLMIILMMRRSLLSFITWVKNMMM